MRREDKTAKIGAAKTKGRRLQNLLSSMAVITMLAATAAHARDALFLGLTDKKGELAQAAVEQAIRHELSVNSKFNLIGETETQRFIREKERLGYSRAEAFVPPGAGFADSVIIIRGIVEELAIDVGRSMLLWGKINARMTVKLYFNEVSGLALYQGEFSASASKRKNFLLFANAKKTVHVSAADRSELMGMMRSETVKKVSDFATLFFNSLATGPIHRQKNEETGGDAEDVGDDDEEEKEKEKEEEEVFSP